MRCVEITRLTYWLRYQPHVRLIKRGKASAQTEFGAKFSASFVEGYCFLDRLSWDADNESLDLIGQAEAYRSVSGHEPGEMTPETSFLFLLAQVESRRLYQDADAGKEFVSKLASQVSRVAGRPSRATASRSQNSFLLDLFFLLSINVPIECGLCNISLRFAPDRIRPGLLP